MHAKHQENELFAIPFHSCQFCRWTEATVLIGSITALQTPSVNAFSFFCPHFRSGSFPYISSFSPYFSQSAGPLCRTEVAVRLRNYKPQLIRYDRQLKISLSKRQTNFHCNFAENRKMFTSISGPMIFHSNLSFSLWCPPVFHLEAINTIKW